MSLLNPVRSFFGAYEAEILAGVVLALVVFCMWEVHHQRQIGAANVIVADTKARADEDRKNAAITAAWQAKADSAERDRDATVKTLQAYAAAHPVGDVRLCKRPTNSGGQLSQGPGAIPGSPGTGTGPATVSEVLDGGAGPNIGPDLDAILQAAETLGGLYRASQRGN